MGSMKSLQPDKDMPFDVGGFVRGTRTERPAPAGEPQPLAGQRIMLQCAQKVRRTRGDSRSY